jgi:DNA mismatch repair protein MutS
VVEKMMQKGEFVSNDLVMNQDDERFLIITGPNMAGKSTYMRQVALISLMAQIGSFVPAKSADLPICDRIFTRIGASDDLAGGKSTFMVEMSEVSDILINATGKSLIILDEVGRGTSTYDGLSIAWAVIEYILSEIPGAKTLFATHYHELTVLEGDLQGVKNYSVLVKEVGKSIAFLRKIVPGGADESYGIEVARLAGLPKNLLGRAKEILNRLEKKDTKVMKEVKKSKVQDEVLQLGLFDYEKELMLEKLKSLDIMNMTPMEALKVLHELSSEAKELN